MQQRPPAPTLEPEEDGADRLSDFLRAGRSADPRCEDYANFRRCCTKRRYDYLVLREGGTGAACTRAGQMNVNVVAIEANDVHFPPIGPDERRQNLSADSFDVCAGAGSRFVHLVRG
jgi:hypothetical protein